MDSLKAADTNNDGTLSREEIEAFVQKRMVQRAADRMEKRLDVNGDGKLERKELRAAHHGKQGRHNWHGKHGGKADGWHHKASQQQQK